MDTLFIDGKTVILASWLNDVNKIAYGLNAGTSAALIGYKQTAVASVARDVASKLGDNGIWLEDFGAVNNTDVTTAFNNAAIAAVLQGRSLKISSGRTYLYSNLLVQSNTEMPDMDFSGSVFSPTSAASTFVFEQLGGTGDARQKEIKGLHIKASAYAVPVVLQCRNINSCMFTQLDVDANPASVNTQWLNSIFWSENITLLKPKFTGGKRHLWFSSTGGTDSFARFRVIAPFHAQGNTTNEAFYYADSNVSVYDAHIEDIGGNFASINSCVVYAGGDWSGSIVGPFPFEVNGGSGFIVKQAGGGIRKPTLVGNFFPLPIVDTTYTVQDDGTLLRAYPGYAVPQDNTFTFKLTPTGLHETAVGLPERVRGQFIIRNAVPGNWYAVTACPAAGIIDLTVRATAVSGAGNPPNAKFTVSKASAFTGSTLTTITAPVGDGGQVISVRWQAANVAPEISLAAGATRDVVVFFDSVG